MKNEGSFETKEEFEAWLEAQECDCVDCGRPESQCVCPRCYICDMPENSCVCPEEEDWQDEDDW